MIVSYSVWKKGDAAVSYAFAIEPAAFQAFENEEEQIERCKEWGLLSDKAVKPKVYIYKGNNLQVDCSIVGFVDPTTVVIEFEDKSKHCIHPAYLKEMQANSFNQRATVSGGSEQAEKSEKDSKARKTASSETTSTDADKSKPSQNAAAPKPDKRATPAKTASKKLTLPEAKVKMTAVVKEFATVPNHFTEMDDEVIVYEDVNIVEPPMELGAAWSSHSATLKKLELAVGDAITFEAKVVAKKLTRHPVRYKINNPSKIIKEAP